LQNAFQVLAHLGALGPFFLGIADSSFLFLPFGNDLLIAVLIARRHVLAWEYVPMAAAGSVVGVFLLDLVARTGGEAGLERLAGRKRFEELKKTIDRGAGYAVAIACLAPPPFPFTPVIVAASVFQYPRRKLLAIAFVARTTRFCTVAALAMIFGPQILLIAKSTAFYWTMIGFVVLCVIGSVFSVAGWIRRGRKHKGAKH
jgi:membrane protein YqaA with SNARE-associated domain